MKFYFSGHTTFANRGCEALIRSTIGLLRSRVPDARFIVPSDAIELDRSRWPEAESLGVEFVETDPFPANIKWWNRLARVVPPVERMLVPHFRAPETRERMASCDAMIMSGGDVISLDYGAASLYSWTGQAEQAMNMGLPVALWAASVGPFAKSPHVEAFAKQHLARYRSISVRESRTQAYLAGLQIEADWWPIQHHLASRSIRRFAALARGCRGCAGTKREPAGAQVPADEESRRQLDNEVVRFVEQVTAQTQLGVLLIPHVGRAGDAPGNNDHLYMQSLLRACQVESNRVQLAPPTLNTAQTKHLISNCRFFIGARTHATIAALSGGVPTTSIAYSVKAKGINLDLFGHDEHVLETPDVAEASLSRHLALLRERESFLRRQLAQSIPLVKERALAAADHLLAALGHAVLLTENRDSAP